MYVPMNVRWSEIIAFAYNCTQRTANANYETNYGIHFPAVKKLAKKLKSFDCAKCLQSIFPFLGWIREYSARRDLPLDIISGCTVAIMHIPQGMGYALLANIPPIMGIYTAFFPVLMFFLFGSSRHNSMGKEASYFIHKSFLHLFCKVYCSLLWGKINV